MYDKTTAELVEALREKAGEAAYWDRKDESLMLSAAADRLEVLEAALGCDKRQVLLLPCKIGDPIWWVVTRHEPPHKVKTKYLQRSELYWHNLERVLKEHGKTVFTTLEEAVAALEGVEADG